VKHRRDDSLARLKVCDKVRGLKRGHLYVIEGPDGVGKTTLALGLVRALSSTGRESCYVSFPGKAGGSLGKVVYDLHHGRGQFRLSHLNQTSLQILHIAAHIDLIDGQIKPKLNKGVNVVLDRFWWSSVVYGRIFGANRSSLELLAELELLHWDSVMPAVAFLITRSKPIGLKKNRTWEGHRREYVRIARTERDKYPVQVVRNETSICKAQLEMRRTISQIQDHDQ
jgi:thymidylate kinase